MRLFLIVCFIATCFAAPPATVTLRECQQSMNGIEVNVRREFAKSYGERIHPLLQNVVEMKSTLNNIASMLRDDDERKEEDVLKEIYRELKIIDEALEAVPTEKDMRNRHAVVLQNIRKLQTFMNDTLQRMIEDKFNEISTQLRNITSQLPTEMIYTLLTRHLLAIQDIDSYYYVNQFTWFNNTMFDLFMVFFGSANHTMERLGYEGPLRGWFWDSIARVIEGTMRPFVDLFGDMLTGVLKIALPLINENIRFVVELVSKLSPIVVTALETILRDLETLLESLIAFFRDLLLLLSSIVYKLFVILEKDFYITEGLLLFVLLNKYFMNNNLVCAIIVVVVFVVVSPKREIDSLVLSLMNIPQNDRSVVPK